MRTQRPWALFALGTLAGGAALAWLSHFVLVRARTTAEAALAAQLAEDERTALARMDLLFGPLLARAAARADGWVGNASLRVELPSALLAAESTPVPPSEPLLARIESVWTAPGAFQNTLQPLEDRGQALENWTQRNVPRSAQEYLARGNSNLQNNPSIGQVQAANRTPLEAGPARLGAVQASALLADWEAEQSVLCFARRVDEQPEPAYQALRFDWRELEPLLLSVVTDLFPSARLEPVAPDAAPAGDRLATLPARLVVPHAAPRAELDRSLAAALGGVWIVAALAATFAALALRASQADAARQRRFTAAVTHELRTPLTTFRLYGEMLARGMVPPERQAEYLATIEREAARLGGLVENVLAYARLERGGARPTRERVRLAALVERHRATLAERARRAGTELAVELDSAADVELLTDVEGVGLVLANLLDNACKYGAPAGGHTLEHALRLRASATTDNVTLAVEDDGPGIPAALAETIFRPFERAGRDESDPAPGVGLGLALARDVARALGGELTLEPAARGARFVLRLPRATNP